MFFFTLKFGFHPPSSLRPLVHRRFSFLITSFFLQFTILTLKPKLLQLLLDQTISRVVVKISTAAFKPILGDVFDLLRLLIRQVDRVKSIKRLFSGGTLSLLKLTSG